VTKVVTFGAFVEILPGVEGLVHISELAQHHVENPREIVSQGDQVNVRILEVDAERRRLSLSLKRVEDGMPVQPKPGEEGEPPALGLSDEVFADEVPAAEALEAPAAEAAAEAEPVAEEPAAESEVAAEEPEPVAEEEPVAEPQPEEPEPVTEEEPVAEEEPAAGAEAEAEAPEAEADASDEAAPA
jgi:small subunit ribosomal protein S1